MTATNAKLSSLQNQQSLGLDAVTERLSKLERRLDEVAAKDPAQEFTARGALTTLQAIDDKVSSLMLKRSKAAALQSSSSPSSLCPGLRASVLNGHCADLKELLLDVGSRVDDIYGRVIVDQDYDDYSRDEASPPSVVDRHAARGLLRRLAAPLKKTSRRLKELEASVGERLDAALGTVQVAARDVDRKFGDFFNMTMEMFEHQHHQV